jgi:hypothetical protein
MSGIRIRNDWAQEISIGDASALGFWRCQTFFALLSIVEQLCKPKMLDFVWNGGLFIVLLAYDNHELLPWLMGEGQNAVPLGNQQDPDLAHQMKRRWKNIASRKRRRYRDILPSV